MPDRAGMPGRSMDYMARPIFVSTRLSKRELEVLRLAQRSRTDKEIGLALGITPRTVRAHVQTACGKLGAQGRTHAVVIALSRQLIQFDAITA
jgi:DNA-binding CsgD family transcriptional regulator